MSNEEFKGCLMIMAEGSEVSFLMRQNGSSSFKENIFL